MNIIRFLTGAAALSSVAAPAASQYYPQQAYPQYQQAYPQQAYPQYQQPYSQQAYPSYGYNQGTGNPLGDIIDSLLGNRYNVTDRQAVRRCANAAMAQAGQQYGGYGYNRGGMRVTAISDVQRRGNGLRVSGTMSSGAAGYRGGYGGQYGNENRGYAGGALSFRCNVAYNGAVTGIRIGRAY